MESDSGTKREDDDVVDDSRQKGRSSSVSEPQAQQNDGAAGDVSFMTAEDGVGDVMMEEVPPAEASIDEFDPTLEEFSKEDFDFKVKALLSSFPEDMKDIVRTFRREQAAEEEEETKQLEQALAAAKKRGKGLQKQRLTAEQSRKEAQMKLESEALSKGVNMQLLRELKVAFEKKETSDGGAGVDEGEFLALFGSSLCRGKSEEETRHWFRAIDQNCSGSIQWDEISNYLVNYHEYAEKIKTKKEDYFVSKTIEPKGHVTTRRHHRLPINKIFYSQALDVFYTSSNDGCVMCWSPHSLKATQVVHKSSEGLWVYDFVMIPTNNRMIVLQSDRCFFIYDCYISQNELRHEQIRVFATQGSTTKTFRDGTSYYECVDRSKVTGVSVLTVDRSAVTERVMPHMRLATLLQASSVPIRCFDHVSGLSSGIGAGESICCGMESGQLELFTLQPTSSVPLTPWMKVRSHTAAVTRVKYASELNGVISASLDGTIAVTDIDIRQVVQRLVVQDAILKPQFGFEYKTYHNMLLSWTSRTLHVWNALTGARLTHLSDHDAPILSASVNVDRMVAFVLLENKKIRVWDLRNWRSVGDYVDELPRYCNDSLQFLLWSPKHHYLLSGCSELFALRPREVQERIDAGLVPSNKKYVGHLHPIRDVKVVPGADHMIAIDSHDVAVWGVQTKKLLNKWKWRDADDNVTAFAVAPDTVRVAIGSESGALEMYNYSCGYKIFSMLHSEPKTASVTSVLFIETSASGGPPTCVASIGGAIHSWVAPRENEDDIEAQLSYRHEDPEVTIWWLVCIDARRQTLAATFNNGELRIVSANSMTCTTSIVFHSPADRLLAFAHIPALLASAHADGTVRFFVYDSHLSNIHALIGFQAAFANEETVTCMTHHNSTLIVGDSVGTMSVFELGPLLSHRDYVWCEILPNVTDPFFAHKIRDEIVPFVDLVAAFDAHESSVTSVSVVDGCLATSGGDRHLRNWSIGDYLLNLEYGNESRVDMFASFHLTNEHHFHACEVMVGNDCEKKTVGKLSRALSYTKRGSILAIELRRLRLLKKDRQEREEAGLLDEDEPVEEEMLRLATREPTAISLHRRRVSALVGDFVLRDDPRHNKAFQNDVKDPKTTSHSPSEIGDAPPAQQSGHQLHASKRRKARAANPAISSTGDIEMRKASSLRASRHALAWAIEDLTDPKTLNQSMTSLSSDNADTQRSHVGLLPPIHGALASPSHATKSTVLTTDGKALNTQASASALRPLTHLKTEALELLPEVTEEESLAIKPRRPLATRYRHSSISLSCAGSVAMSPAGSIVKSSPSPSPLSSQQSLISSPLARSQRRSVVGKQGVVFGGSGASVNHSSMAVLPRLLSEHQRPDDVELFRLATDHVMKHQTGLMRIIPDKAVHGKLQEVMRIKQERQDELADPNANGSTSGIFYRLHLLPMDDAVAPQVHLSGNLSALDLMMMGSQADVN